MRSLDDYHSVMALDARGYNRSQIARETGVNRRTVIDWVTGRGPRAFRAVEGGTGCCSVCGHPEHDSSALDAQQYSYLLGIYLGDGYVATMRRTSCLRVFMDSRHPRIIGACVRAIRAVMPANRVTAFRQKPSNCVEIQCSSRQWPCLIPQHGRGLKHERPIALAEWQAEITARHAEDFVRGLIHSDGCRFMNRIRHGDKVYVYPRYNFSNRSEDIKAIFCEHLDLLGIEWRRMNAWNISVARRESVARLDEFVGPKR